VSPAPVETPTVQLPALAEVPLPRPRPPLTPAQELGLEGNERTKAEKCLAQAIYFEARNEPLRGQIGVAQVVLNRVFSPYYPDTVCGVVFQNAHRFLSCQFTFACDGKSKAIRERAAWGRAQRIAKQALDSTVWLPDVAKSTHYHATYVRPRWVREMKKMVRHGQHIFYRPHRWGDGADEAGWGVASLTHSAPQKTKTSRH
jgi:spore germination cell wall hydrolase CwlJ-like protein